MSWDEDGIPKLLWSPTWTIHVAASGEHRKIYGVEYKDAKAMSVIYGLQFFDCSASITLPS